jgi:dipeptidyl aminopeptidase/acylaminoacyl peptidase
MAFLRRGKERTDPAQVHVIPADGGEAWQVSEFDLGATELAWSPDGTQLAAVGMSWRNEWSEIDNEEERARRPRRITELGWRRDDKGWVHDRRSHVYLLDPFEKGTAALLTPGDFNETGIAWHPDGDRVAFLSARHPEREFDTGSQAFEVPRAGGNAEAVVDVGLWMHVSYRPDGIAHLVGRPDRWDWPSVPSVYRLEGTKPVDVLPALDRSPMPLIPAITPAGPQWVGNDFFTTLEDDGRVAMLRVSENGDISVIDSADHVVSGLSPAADGGAVAFTATSPTDPGELMWWENGTSRRLTAINDEFSADTRLAGPQPFEYERDGAEIHGWVYLPPGENQVPLLLNVHGGPASQYGYNFFDEFQVYVEAGYGVVACNPRGSSGRGRDYVRAVVGQWDVEEPLDMQDILAAVEAAAARFPRLDRERVGVMGGSYGGLATLRLTAMDQRFKSAIVERCVSSFNSFAGTSDIGTWFDQAYLDAQIPADWDRFQRASPINYAHRITTPTLVIHSEADFRTPIEQGEQAFVMLKRMGVETEMLRFPDESHELSRSGRPRHRQERLEAILDWHSRHLL